MAIDLRRLQRLHHQSAAKYSAPTVDAEYLSALWNADIESVRRTKIGRDCFGCLATTKSFLNARTWDASTRVVTFEMCGNDGLQARSAFKTRPAPATASSINTAVANCKTYVAKAMDYINASTYAGVKAEGHFQHLLPRLYNADNVQSSCKDATTGATINVRDKFLPAMATINYWMCEYARQKGFKCTDNFAEFMGADYDSNGDGIIDADGLRYVSGESESSYVTRITSTLKSTIRDSNTKFVSSSSSYDYIQSDDTHRPITVALSLQACWVAQPAQVHHATPRSLVAKTRSGTPWAVSAWAGRYRPPADRTLISAPGTDPWKRRRPRKPSMPDPGKHGTWRPSMGYL